MLLGGAVSRMQIPVALDPAFRDTPYAGLGRRGLIDLSVRDICKIIQH